MSDAKRLPHVLQPMTNVCKWKSLCQLISDTLHAGDATQLVALRPVSHAHISTCQVFALCLWLTVSLHSRYTTVTGSSTTLSRHYKHVWQYRVFQTQNSNFSTTLKVANKWHKSSRAPFGCSFLTSHFLLLNNAGSCKQTMTSRNAYRHPYIIELAVYVGIAVFSNKI